MILFENGIIKLEYNPATDILEIAYPDLHDFLLAEIKHSIDILVDTVKGYDVKRVLLDSTKTSINVSNKESRAVTVYLAAGLTTTRVQKVARLQAQNAEVEREAQGNIGYIREVELLSFRLQNFTDKEVAVQWLLKS